MVIGKKPVGIEIRQPVEFIDVFGITDMPGVYLAGGNTRVYPFVVLPVIQTGKQDIETVEQHSPKNKEEYHVFLGKAPAGMERQQGGKRGKKEKKTAAC